MERHMLVIPGDIETNPGPTTTPTVAGVPAPADAKEAALEDLTISTVNVSSFKNRFEELKKLAGSHVICLQETALTAAGIAETDYALRMEKSFRYTTVWGKGQRGRVTEGIESIEIGQRGGVAILVKQPRVVIPGTLEMMDADECTARRWVHARISIDGKDRWLHIFTIYCPSGKTTEDAREKFLEYIFRKKTQELGEVPIVVCGDFNTDEERSKTLSDLLGSGGGWMDAAVACALRKNTTPEDTFVKKNCSTRIDRVLMNPHAAASLVDCEVHKKITGTDHKGITVTLRLSKFMQKVSRYMIPKEIPPTTGISEEDGRRLLANTDFARHIENKDAAKASQALSRCCEEVLIAAAGITEGVAAYKGRSQYNKPKAKQVCVPTTRSSCGAANIMQVRLEKTASRLHAARKQLKQLIDKGGAMQLPQALCNTLTNINRDAIHTSVTCEQIDDSADFESILISIEEAQLAVRKRIDEITARQRAARARAYEQALHSTKAEVKKLVDGVKGKSTQVGTSTVVVDGTLHADPERVDTTMREAWEAVMCLYKDTPEPEYGPFKEEFRRYIQKHPMQCEPITGKHLAEVLAKKGTRSAAGVDGWRFSELKALPVSLLDGWAQLYNLVEETGVWPEEFTTALVTLIPKCENAGPLEHRPITVTSAVYRLWACARIKAILLWQERWVCATQHGYRSKHGTEDAILDIATRIEEAILNKEPLVGLSLDFVKCFDRVPQGLVLELVEDLGMDSGVLRALRGMYAALRNRRRFRYTTGVGQPFETTNGILQGCPISVVLVNALLAVLMKRVEDRYGVDTVSYADDAYFMTRLPEMLQGAADELVAFCEMVGMELSVLKSRTFSTAGKAPRIKAQRGKTLQSTKVLSVLGTEIGTDGAVQMDARIKGKLVPAVRKLMALPLSMKQKAWIVSSSILPSYLYCVPYNPPSESGMKQLTTAIACCLWGPRYRTRSPDALLTVLYPAHTHDPEAAAVYRIVGTLARSWKKNATVAARCDKIAEMYTLRRVSNPKDSKGVVGNVLLTWLPKVNTDWQGLQQLCQKMGSALAHGARELGRQRRARAIMAKRSTMGGLSGGADPQTNDLWKELDGRDREATHVLQRIITGGVFYVHPNAWKDDTVQAPPPEPEEDTSSDESTSDEEASDEVADDRRTAEDATARQQVVGCTLCRYRGPSSTMLEHRLWECDVAKKVQQQEGHRQVVAARHGLPQCLKLHGIKPRGCNHDVRSVQLYLLEVVVSEDAMLKEKREMEAYHMHPWRVITEGSAHPVPTWEEFKKATAPSGAVLLEYAKPVLRWMKQLKWYQGPRRTSVTMVELAIDFEQSVNMSLWGVRGDARILTEKARRLRHVMQTMCKLWDRRRGASTKLLPAKPISNSYALRSIGGERAMGYDRRPLFVSDSTVSSLETVMARRYKRDRLQRIRNLVQTPSVGSRQLPQSGDRHR
eukprot:TRINITY_DN162_c0_g3_i3.p1 TRINITY_DN162_c0_g3~~TRINITY_DN162_c0_g3_i3.p1  ORF type:complete len:1446 (+),score=342.28 TRINITY_DN162_c0_g3_i3:2232-6569(+)